MRELDCWSSLPPDYGEEFCDGDLGVALGPATVIVAVDPGKVTNRVWVSDGTDLLEKPVSLSVARSGIAALEKMLAVHAAAAPVIAIESTGSLHRAWAAELERLHPGAIRLFAPSQTKAARMQLGSGRFKTDDRDCAALTYLARQGGGRGQTEEAQAGHPSQPFRQPTPGQHLPVGVLDLDVVMGLGPVIAHVQHGSSLRPPGCTRSNRDETQAP